MRLGGSLMRVRGASRTMGAMKLTLPILAASVAAFLVPAAAQAATLSYSGDTLVYTADPGVRDSPMLGASQDGTKLGIFEEGLTFPAGCEQPDPNFGQVYCDMPAR